MAESPLASTAYCPACKNRGFVLDHDDRCPGGGPLCNRYCPVEVPCPECASRLPYVAVFIAVGSLPSRSEVQRDMNCDTYEDAEGIGIRHLASGHWTTFTVEKRYYPREAAS